MEITLFDLVSVRKKGIKTKKMSFSNKDDNVDTPLTQNITGSLE